MSEAVVNQELHQNPAIDYERYTQLLPLEGPQLTGYNPDDFAAAVADGRTGFVDVVDGTNIVRWPVVSPVKNYTELMPRYFNDTYGEGASEHVYYLSLPRREFFMHDPTVQTQLADQLGQLADERAMVVFDSMAGDGTVEYLTDLMAVSQSNVTVELDEFVDPSNNTPASEIHFEGLTLASEAVKATREGQPYSAVAVRETYSRLVQSGEIDLDTPSHPVLLDPTLMDLPYKNDSDKTTMDRLWEVYNASFTQLIENTPFRGQQTRQELETMLKDPNTLVVAQTVDGEIAAFVSLVGDISACEWLDPEFYARKYPDGNVLYFPDMATDPAMRGERYSVEMTRQLLQILATTIDHAHLVFQCTNVSADYIPMLVQEGINASALDFAHVESISEISRYRYQSLRLSR